MFQKVQADFGQNQSTTKLVTHKDRANGQSEQDAPNICTKSASHKPASSLTVTFIWVWVKIKPTGARRFWSMFPLARVPFWVPICDPQPYVFIHPHWCEVDVHPASGAPGPPALAQAGLFAQQHLTLSTPVRPKPGPKSDVHKDHVLSTPCFFKQQNNHMFSWRRPWAPETGLLPVDPLVTPRKGTFPAPRPRSAGGQGQLATLVYAKTRLLSFS